MFKGFSKPSATAGREPPTKRPKTNHTWSSSSTSSTSSSASSCSGSSVSTALTSAPASPALEDITNRTRSPQTPSETESQAPELDLDPTPTSIDSAFPTFTEAEYDAAFRPKSISVYVKAFNFALDTVLKHESHLFDEDELECFGRYKSLPYEAQYLYVRLFLRKTSAWFRCDKLKYYSDVGDIPRACQSLQDKEVGLAQSEADLSTLEEAAELLSLDELKGIAKEAKVSGTNKGQLLAGLKKASRGQACFQGKGQLRLGFDENGTQKNRDAYFIGKIVELIGPCIRLTPAYSSLFNRVHLVFYRSTEYTEHSLKTVILARMSKRNFPDYIVSRTSNIFPTRASLLEFEKAIKLQSEVDEILTEGVPTREGLEKVLGIFESIWPRWRVLVAEEGSRTNRIQDHDGLMERVYLRRFNAAWVYTRIVHKGVYVLGRFKNYAREHEVLTALLDQKFFHGARRGGWYQRKALIEENYMAATTSPNPTEAAKKQWRQRALQTCIAGLRDPLTHFIYHYELQKRISKLEKKLKIPHRDQHVFDHVRLRTPTHLTIYGTLLTQPTLGRKTLWHDPLTPHTAVSVEELALSHYRSKGWKGYHSESRIVTTIFALLFYDILFCYLPNVFETEYQSAPLDLFTDSFLPARASEIRRRLVEIENGMAPEIVRAVDEAQREKQTCVVGLDWSFGGGDLVEVVAALGGRVLSAMCKVLCEEYAVRRSGVPDLLVWRRDLREAVFVEVKSERDRLSETQRVWIDVICSAGGRVELCSVIEEGRREEWEGSRREAGRGRK